MTANAAIWYAADGYEPSAKGINGRRVAGESFLRGYLAHGVVGEHVCVSSFPSEEASFRAFAAKCGVSKPIRGVRLDAMRSIAPVDVVYYSAPNFATECWRRAPLGGAAYGICSVTHTTATKAVMQGMFDLRSAPQMPWDAVICTSRAVQSTVRMQMELAEAHLAARFAGAVLPARPLTPVIPLGIHCDDFAPDAKVGKALRKQLGVARDDVVAACIARLTAEEKFDPLPLFIALQAAAEEILAKGGGRLHLVLCGQFPDATARRVFDRGAEALMPSVGYHVLDGADGAQRKATLSAADFFVFPIDNVQETFGLAPVEAMAAGLPVIVSDWDGMKDAVTDEVGFRIPTEVAEASLVTYLGLRYYGGTDGYLQYLGQLSAMTRLDVRAMIAAIVSLASDPDLRARMGAAGKARARALYDWRVVIPQMQALWQEQSQMLAHARSVTPARRDVAAVDPARLPVAPGPFHLYAGYPSNPPPVQPDRRFRAVPLGARPNMPDTFALRDYATTRRLFEDPARIAAVLAALDAAGPEGTTADDLATAAGQAPRVVQRVLIWLMKYHFAEDVR
ncbi:glycosyltransferase family 4 protein [Tabrizicola sp.]|uniref:glycosyltransferase family 4 protein n=1 Tax=Tabrizicola sp. TaxID=2005166 RepID=UPI00286BF62A|nr:glycosyltransferase family 4 protein [Tabrizicola sp.]